MNTIASDQRIESIVPMRSPEEISTDLPLSVEFATRIVDHRAQIANIIHGKDKRLLVVIGPCSIHDPVAAIEYAERLLALRQQYIDTLEIVMRVYFEKPRTTVGWKGLINDPHMDGSCEIDQGLHTARALLLKLAAMGLPAGCEFLDAATGQFYADTVSWGAIGARTTESQVHRELASGLSCPVGFKNGTDGNIGIGLDAMLAAGHTHAFLSPDPSGKIALYRTTGNSDAHLILRGGKEPNYQSEFVKHAYQQQQAIGLKRRIIVDCSHANSKKDYKRQSVVLESIASRLNAEIDMIGGVMVESHLVEGNQKFSGTEELVYGQSITDACVGWSETQELLRAQTHNTVYSSYACLHFKLFERTNGC